MRAKIWIKFALVAMLLVLAAPAVAQEDGPPTMSPGDITSKIPGWLGGDKPEFLRLPPFNVPAIREGGVVGQITLKVTIETLGRSNKQKLIDERARIQSAFLQDLYGVASINNGSGKTLNLDTVKFRLQRVADRVVGAGVVKDVLVENAYTREFN